MAIFVPPRRARATSTPLAGLPRRQHMILALALSLVAAGVMRLPVLELPIERDEGAYAYAAQVWLQGGLPYRDVFDHKPPLIYLLYMPALLVGDPGPVAIRVWNSILFVLQLPLIYVLGRKLWDTPGALLAVVMYAIVGSSFSLQALVLNTEQALVLPALVGLFALLRAVESDHPAWAMLYGFALGLVSLIKPAAVPFLVPLVLLGRAPGLSGRLRRLLLAGGGLLLPFIPVVALWGWAGALDELGFALITYNRLYAAQTLGRWSIGEILAIFALISPLLVCAIGGAALGGLREVRQRQRLAVALWTLGFLAAGLASLRAYVHYYYPALHGLVLLAVGVVTTLRQPIMEPAPPRARLAQAAAVALLLLVLLVPSVSNSMRHFRKTPADLAQALYGPEGRDYFAAADQVAAYIRARTRPEDPIYVWASEPAIYLLSERRTSSRYIYTYPLELVPGAEAELLRDLRNNPPAVVVSYHAGLPPAIEALAAARGLRRETIIGGFDVWALPTAAAR